MPADLSTEDKRIAADVDEAIGTVCDLRDRVTVKHGRESELAQRLVTALIALYDVRTEAQRIARDS